MPLDGVSSARLESLIPKTKGDEGDGAPSVGGSAERWPVTSISRVDSAGAILDELRADLKELDETLRRGVDAARAAFADRAGDRQFAGLVITADEPVRLLARPLGALVLGGDEGARAVQWRNPRLTRTVQACGLSDFDTAVLLLACAPEIDLRYERVFAYLQDDVTRKRPSIALALDLFAPEAASKLTLQERFRAHAPLRQHGLLELVSETEPGPPPLPAHGLRPSPGVVRFMLGEEAIDEPFSTCFQLEIVEREGDGGGRLPEDLERRLTALGERSDGLPGPIVLLEGGDRLECRDAARALALGASRPLLTADLSLIPSDGKAAFAGSLRRVALLHGAVVHLTRSDAEEVGEIDDAGTLFSGDVPLVVESATASSLRHAKPADARVVLPVRDFSRRQALWSAAVITERGAADGAASISDLLARGFRLSPAEVEEVMATARAMARWRATSLPPGAGLPPSPAELMEAARTVGRARMEGLARRIVPNRNRSELILPDNRLRLLDAIRAHVEFAPVVSEQWGFARTMTRGAGIVALFSGPPGTGKTLAAEVLAGELGLDLYAIDLSQVVSKYIGETEKNLARVFDAAESSNAVLFFDEADALFGARSEVHDAHDRYANIEVSYLLQRMEEYSGLAVLASNLQRNIDEAFLRRVRFVISFPLPDPDSRRRIWETTWPSEAPSSGLDWDALATRFDVAGATIRDAAVGAAFLAAADGTVATMAHVEEAMRREYSKLGRVPADASSRAPTQGSPITDTGGIGSDLRSR